MSITPINITRVSHNLRSLSMLDSLRRNTVDMFVQQNRLATGRALTTPSDDPVAASQALRMKQTLSRQDQILGNLRHADLMMGAADEALSEVNELLNQAEAISSQSIGAQADADERAANAAIIASIRERLTTIGNRQVRGSYIFAGRATQQPPFTSALGGVAYLGDTGNVFARVSQFEQEAINMPGDTLFGALSAAVPGKNPLQPSLSADTRLDDLLGVNGRGIRKGAILLTDSSGASAQADLSTADTVGDVVDSLNAAAAEANMTLTVAIQGKALVATQGSVTILDSAGGTAASDLGLVTDDLRTASTAPPDLRPRVTPNTLLDSLNAGEGIDRDSGFKITNGNASEVIDLTDADTVQDVLNRINAADLYVTAQINDSGDGIDIVSQVSGVNLSIAENGGKTATSLGIGTMDATTPLASLNFGRGVETLLGEADITVTGRSGTAFDVNLDGAQTVGDVITLINEAATEAGVNVTAALNAEGNGIMLQDTSGGDGALTVARADIDAFAGDDLGLLQSVEDPEADLVGDEVSAVRAGGIFSALIELEKALAGNDERAIGQIAERLVTFSGEVTRVHGIIGARAQAFSDRTEQTENAVVATQQFLSEIEDLDYTAAVTRFQQAQTALQANLLTGSQLLNLSLLDFIA